MPSFEIRYGEAGFDIDHLSHFQYFDVRCGGAEARVGVGLSELVRRRWELDSRADGDDVQRRVILHYLKDHLASVAALSLHRVLLTPRDHPDVGEGWTVQRVSEELPYEWKECRYRLEKEGEYYCSAAKRDDDWAGKTTLAICQDCGMPSTDTACSNLVHPYTQSFRGMVGPPTRHLYDVQCQLGRTVSETSAAECVPGGRDCWVQTYEPEEAAVAAEPGERNLATEVLDTIDTLNMIFRDEFDVELFRLKQTRTVRVLMGPCGTEEGFAHKLQVLGDLIDLMNSKELGEAQGVTSKPGSVNWLAAFLERVGQGDTPPVIRALRDIKTVRKQLAAHSAAADDYVEACGRLGIDLPVTDWEGAWHRLLSAFLEALRRLQGLLP